MTMPDLDPAAPEPEPAAGAPRHPSAARRFGLAFALGILASLVLAAGSLAAYDAQHDGRILPGVRVGTTDLSGLDAEAATQALTTAYAPLGEGEVVLTAGESTVRIPFAAFDRRVDVEAMVALAMAVGRSGSPVDRAVAEVRTAIDGIDLGPIVTYDAEALRGWITRNLTVLERRPTDGTIAMTEEGVETTPAVWGRTYDPATVASQAEAAVAPIDAPAEIVIAAELQPVRPTIDDTDTALAVSKTGRMVADVVIAESATAAKEGKDRWTIKAATVRTWIDFRPTSDGRVEPVVDPAAVEASLAEVAKQVARKPKNASFLIGDGGQVVGVTASVDGRALDAATTAQRIVAALGARAAAAPEGLIEPAIAVTKPTVTTAEAEKSAPLMKVIGTWTTYFPISEKNGFGANIWIPTKDIDGYVVGPGEWFDWWKAIGPVTRERGYKDGGAIINGRTEPQGALAGGMCSCSTTLFNAALRAGLQMGARQNHYYYIDRYPLGLDATVWKSGAGSVQSMTFRNDTDAPILIRGIGWRNGSKGYVRFDLYSVPTGRKVSLSTPIVRDINPATTRTEYTSTLPAGARKQIEYPVAGRKVWVTRTVRNAAGAIIHQETYYSNYKRIDGIILVGRGSDGGPSPTPSPAPTASPKPTPAPSPTPEPSPSG
jgi:vancomycin resistance protein YoaR